ncbi:hypothetical protein CVT26_013806 [Gymnopilus dilepis]|uniref:Uncharacterized protein n=1 Tax=Gymnopilus dilepis TaxID=231916 RepID=A0A409WSV5_9AGAR|nr:hypothetical protein CVT26_013806 [Gymnopilus dilepis]
MVNAAVNLLCFCVLMALIGVFVLRVVDVWYGTQAPMEVVAPRATYDGRERRRGNRRTVIVDGGTFILARGDARFYGTGDIVASIEAGGRALRAISGTRCYILPTVFDAERFEEADLVIVRGGTFSDVVGTTSVFEGSEAHDAFHYFVSREEERDGV